jgi:hypothetical protein
VVTCQPPVLKNCSSAVTFELDAVFNRYDGESFFGRSLGVITDLPDKYRDTSLFDGVTGGGENEPRYTVGTSDAWKLQANRRYHVLMRTTQGNASSDLGKLVAQAGVRLPAKCTRPVCNFAMASEFLVLAWNHSVPGNTQWTK